MPELRAKAHALVAAMDFGFYYDPAVGQLRGGAWTEKPPGCSVAAGRRVDDHATTTTSSTPSRGWPATSGIAAGQVPPEHYFHLNRTFSPLCGVGDFQETQPSGETRTYLGVDVYEGHYDYRGMHIVPTWGGDMFEALMVPLFVPEERWGPRSWGVNHPLYVRAQIEHGLDEARYGYWGFSPSDNPSGGYSAYGVDAIGMQADGYPSNNDNTFVDHGFGDCRPAEARPAAVGLHQRRRHAARLVPGPALRAARGARQPREAALALRRLRQGRLLRRRQRPDRRGGALLPRARPGHGHGGGRQRAERRLAAELLRPRRDRAAHPPAAGDGAVHRGLRRLPRALAALRGRASREGSTRPRGRRLRPPPGSTNDECQLCGQNSSFTAGGRDRCARPPLPSMMLFAPRAPRARRR